MFHFLSFIEYTVSMFESTTGTKKWNVTFYEYSAREITEETPYGDVYRVYFIVEVDSEFLFATFIWEFLQ